MEEKFSLIERKKHFYRANEKYLSAPDYNYGTVRDMLYTIFFVNYNYESTAIEGNPLSRLEHNAMFYRNECPATEKMTTIYEAVNHADAFHFIIKKSTAAAPFSEAILLEVHQDLVHHIFEGGKYRDCNVGIRSASHPFPRHEEVEQLMEKFFTQFRDKEKKLHPIELAAWVHEEFINIHPFQDGNGRTARLLMNFILIQNNYWPVSIPVERKEDYFIIVDEYFEKRDIMPFAQLIAELEDKQLDRAINLMEPFVYPVDMEKLMTDFPETYLEEMQKKTKKQQDERKRCYGF